MIKATNEKVLKKVFEHAEAVDKYCAEHNMRRAFTGLFGSQNYGLDEENSDVDTKSLIIPDAADWLWSTEGAANYVITMPDGSHAEMKPVVSMFKQWIKGSQNFMEILYTPYVDIAPEYEWLYKDLVNVADNIAHTNMYRQVDVWAGYAKHMLYRSMGHEDSGFNYKELMHAVRLYSFGVKWFKEQLGFEEASDETEHREYLLSIKHNSFSNNYLNSMIIEYTERIRQLVEWVKHNYEDKNTFNTEFFLRQTALEIFNRLLHPIFFA